MQHAAIRRRGSHSQADTWQRPGCDAGCMTHRRRIAFEVRSDRSVRRQSLPAALRAIRFESARRAIPVVGPDARSSRAESPAAREERKEGATLRMLARTSVRSTDDATPLQQTNRTATNHLSASAHPHRANATHTPTRPPFDPWPITHRPRLTPLHLHLSLRIATPRAR